jgi:Flp pilus assembly protein TadD
MSISRPPPAGGCAPPGKWLRTAACAAMLAVLGGCRDTGDVTGSINSGGAPPVAESQSDLRAEAADLGKRFDSNPGEKSVSISYARTLRALTQYSQAVAVMQAAAVKAPSDLEVLSAYGKALADAGQLQQAAEVLSRSYTAERPNWSNMNVQGSVSDQLGDHPQAQKFYHDALKIAPGEPTILNNLGLSYALTKQLTLAEQTLRQAADSPRADARMRENLALVLALEGKFAEAERVERQDLSAEAAADNVAAIRQMIAQSNSWRDIEALDTKKRHAKSKPSAPAADNSSPPAIDNPPG